MFSDILKIISEKNNDIYPEDWDGLILKQYDGYICH